MLELSQLLRLYIKRRFDRLNRPANDAEDVVQEALLAIHNRRHTYEPDLPVTAWAYAIARYKLIDHLRANNHEFQMIPLDDVDSVVDVRDQVEAKIAVQNGVSALPDSLRLPS
ncbi:sigma factor [uncultured Sphingorhabdus sp.]|uniref:sigma factor n=1 Tax=uncultured Sphingorhabdus sp. TaxID=1686106 RepID=UPI0026152959|nr:sigma factor [uncultured Sphingorhabdus sp.]